jgi:hypothetical protein
MYSSGRLGTHLILDDDSASTQTQDGPDFSRATSTVAETPKVASGEGDEGEGTEGEVTLVGMDGGGGVGDGESKTEILGGLVSLSMEILLN